MAWSLSLLSTKKFFLDYYNNMTIINPVPSHNAIAYNIQDLKEIYELVVNNYQYANETLNSLVRHILTLQTQHFVDLYEFNVKHRKVNSLKFNVFPMDLLKLHYLNSTDLFAINTGGDKVYTEEEYKNQREIMQLRFPNKTPYEIEDLSLDYKKDCKSTDEEINYMNALKHKYSELTENEFVALVNINKKKTYIIKIYNWLVILLIILIIILFYLLRTEKNKNKNLYTQLSDNEGKVIIL